jgi:hypothetical protein
MKKIKARFTIIELVTASTLTLIMFMMIGYVFSSVSDITATLNDKISEGLRANNFFSKLADDLESSFPVFELGAESDGSYLKISEPAAANPLGPLLPTGNFTKGSVNGTKNFGGPGAAHLEVVRCVATNHINGGLLSSTGFESMNVSDNVDQNDKPVRFVSYNYMGEAEVVGGHPPRSVYRRDFPLRPDLRKGLVGKLKGGYSVGDFVKVGLPGNGETAAANRADGDINETLLLEGIWEVRTEFKQIPANSTILDFGEKVLVRVTIEFAITDFSKEYNDTNRYKQYSNADLDSNGKNDRLEHTYTTVIVVNRNNWSN